MAIPFPFMMCGILLGEKKENVLAAFFVRLFGMASGGQAEVEIYLED